MRRVILTSAFILIFLTQAAVAQQTFCTQSSTNACYLTASELQQIQSDPSSFKSIFLAHYNPASPQTQTPFLTSLGPEFSGMTEEGAAMAFAGIAAYELKSYRFSSTDPAPASWQLADLLAVQKLVCNEYVNLAIDLFYEAYPQSNGSLVKINPVGWRRDSPTANHAQILVTGVKVPILVDPTLGLVAKVTLNSLFLHTPLTTARVRELTWRKSELGSFRLAVRNALLNGQYDPAYLIYSYLSADAGQTGGPKPFYDWPDFTSAVAKGPDKRFWYTTGAGALWEINQNGIALASTTGIAQIATGLSGGAIYFRTTSGVVYRKTSGSSWTLVSRSGVTSIASGLSGQIIFLLMSNGDLWKIGSSGWQYAGPSIGAIATGLNVAGTYERAPDSGAVWVYTSSGWSAVSPGGISWITGEKNGQGIYALSSSGALYRINNSGTWSYLGGGVTDVEPGVGGLTINVLKSDGTVWQGDLLPGGDMNWNTGNFTWTQFWTGSTFTSISLLEGGTQLDATRVDGQHLTTSASSY
jgi:hypothetical protein